MSMRVVITILSKSSSTTTGKLWTRSDAHFCKADAAQNNIFEAANPTNARGCLKTRITVSFLFVLFRVIWWIACYAPRKAIPAHHTN